MSRKARRKEGRWEGGGKGREKGRREGGRKKKERKKKGKESEGKRGEEIKRGGKVSKKEDIPPFQLSAQALRVEKALSWTLQLLQPQGLAENGVASGRKML